jgi:hypothetical protein
MALDEEGREALESYKEYLRSIFDDSTDVSGTATGAIPGIPQNPTDAGFEARPNPTSKPAASPPPPVRPAPISKVPEPPPMDSKGDLEKNAKRKLQEALKRFASPDKNLGLNFNDKWISRLGSTAVPYTGLGKDFARKTGVNDVGHKNTLRYSRLVDALNNKRFITPGQAGVRSTYSTKGGRTGRADAIDYGDVYKMDGLETAESRAQRRAEGYEKEDTERRISRKNDVMDMPAAMERLKQLAVIEQAGKLTEDERAEQKQLFNSILNNQYNIPSMMMQDYYRSQLHMNEQQYQTELALILAQYAAMNGLTTQEYAAKLGMDQSRYNTMLGMVSHQFAAQLARYIHFVTGMEVPIAKADYVLDTPDYLHQMLYGGPGALGTGSPDPQSYYFAYALQALTGTQDMRQITMEQWISLYHKLNAQMAEFSRQAATTAQKTTETDK